MPGQAKWKPNWSRIAAFPKRPGGKVQRWLPRWSEATNAWIASVREGARAEGREVGRLLATWDTALEDFGGDPVRDDWEEFRPLRLTREEDWSDWLAYLIGRPEGHVIADLFLPEEPAKRSVVEDAVREEPVTGGKRRADLIVLWSGQKAVHVEVKIWDEDFGKTTETGQGCRSRYQELTGWRDYILIPEENGSKLPENDPRSPLHVVTWTEVAEALRRSMTVEGASPPWRTFARALCGAIEQKILGVPRFEMQGESRELVPVKNASSLFRFGRIVRGASANGQGQ